MKKIALFAFLVLILSLFVSAAFAQSATDFVEITHVEVNGVPASEYSPIRLERGENVHVQVNFRGNPFVCDFGEDNPCYDTRAEVEIQGYEYGEVRDVVGPFEVESGASDSVFFNFELPADMPASDDLNLNIEFKDDDHIVFVSFPVRIQERRHQVSLFDVVLNPTSNVQAGQPLFVTARVENLGDNVESSVKVTASVPSLGIQTSEFIDRLATTENEDYNDVDDAATTNDLLLMIPSDATEGNYQVVVSVEYNRGFSLEEKVFTIHVDGADQTPTTPGVDTTGVLVNIESETLRVRAGEGAVYKFSIANLGQTAESFTLDVIGVGSWANVRVDPAVVVVQPNSAKDVHVFVAPNEDVQGVRTFSVNVMSGNEVLSESQLMLDVVEGGSNTTAKTVFTWIFVILLILLVILVIVVVAKKLSENKEGGIESQTYY